MKNRGAFGGTRGGASRGSFNKAMVECYKCHKLGHFQNECPDWEKGANYAEVEGLEYMVLMAQVDVKDVEQIWFLDTGCSNHMCGEKKWFSDLEEGYKHTVKLGDNSKMLVVGRGNVKLETEGASHIITNVYYIPELKNNLISNGQLVERGMLVLIQREACKLYHPESGLIMKSVMTSNRMFVIKAKMMAHLWHCRYGHLSYNSLRTLQSKSMVRGIPEIKVPSKLCKNCITGK